MNHRKKITNYFETDYPLNRAGLDELISSFELREYPKHKMLINQGDSENSLRFLTNGSLREFYATGKKEINIDFYTSPQFITDFSSFIYSKTTKKNQEALSPVEVLELGKEKFLRLLDKYSCGKSFVDETFKNVLKSKEAFEYNRITKEPELLYNELHIYKPEWLQKIPQYHIASYLGITPETLSRIRGKHS